MSYYYEKIDGKYVLHSPMGDVVSTTEHVALSYSYDPEMPTKGTLLKHGDPHLVLASHNERCRKYQEAGFPEETRFLYLMQGAFEIEDLNKCLQITGYVGTLHERMRSTQH